jgi:two-component system, response regulator YesN
MLSVLIVDDEKVVRDFLTDFIPWADFGFTNVYQAENGEKAYLLALKTLPDLMLVDIMMPKMNGVELLTRVKEELPDTIAIILSAYSDKAYLKAAIRLGVSDYIEKPIDIDELIRIVQSAVKRIDDQRRANEHNLLKEKIINELCGKEASGLPREVLAKKSGLEGFSGYTVLLLHAASANQIDIAANIIKKQLEGKPFRLLYTNRITQGQAVALVLGANTERQQLTALMERYHLICHTAQLPLFTAVGLTAGCMQDIHLSYQSACRLIRREFYLGGDGIVWDSRDFQAKFQMEEDFPDAVCRELANYNRDKAAELLHSYTQKLKELQPENIDYVRNTMFQILQSIGNYAKNKIKSLDEFHDEQNESIYLWQVVSSFKTVDQFYSYVSKLIDWIYSNRTANTQADCINRITQYIHENVNNYNLSVGTVSEYMCITPSYLCQLFKKGMNVTLNQYITEQRVLEGQRLLSATAYSLPTVARQVGYSDPKYFAKLFKRQTGTTPTEYRRLNHR